jgi:hypothetical protein
VPIDYERAVQARTAMPLFRRFAPLRIAIALTLPLCAALSGCESNVQEKIALAKLAQNCLVNSDCSTPLVCAFEACHAECESSRDCDEGARCVAAARPYKVCQLEEERLCERTSDCAEGLICGVDGECRDHCASDSECVEGQQCVAGTCADNDELDEAGQLTPAPGVTRGSEGSSCVYVSDCSAALLCRNQACLPQCKADKDCPLHEVCADTRCVPDGSLPLACGYTSDCDTERGERCLGGSCLCACAEDRDCPAGQACDGCGCAVDPSAPKSCVYNSDCEAAGEICKNRACACECQADRDCGEGSKCDGCGCVDFKDPLDGIVVGNVYIESTLQLATYQGVTEIHGDLSISGRSIVDLGDTFDDLRRIEGRLMVSDNRPLARLAFPALESVDMVSVSAGSALETIEMPALKHGVFSLGNLSSLKTLSVSGLETGGFELYDVGGLKQLSLPAVTSLSSLILSNVTGLEKLELPKLTKIVGILRIASSYPGSLSVLSAPKLKILGEAINGSNLLISNTQLSSLDDLGAADWVVNATSLDISQNPLLSRCAAEAFAQRCAAAGFTGAPTITENAGCTTCAGATCQD